MSLKLEYKPEVLVDTEGLSNEEWLEWRKKGVGGSDVAAIYNISPFKTKRDLYYEKTNTANAISSKDDNWVAKEVGHRLEDLVAEIFAKKTGFKVWNDKKMYKHPLFPFMLADIDRFVMDNKGKIGILECKTGHFLAQSKWADGKVPVYYEYQGRHYMCVMNVDFVYFACLYGNNERDFTYTRVDRDLEQEENMIMEEENFWNNNVFLRVEPPYIGDADLALESIRKHFGGADKSIPEIIISSTFEDNIKSLIEVKAKKQELERESRNLEKVIKQLYVPIVEQMGTACKAKCEGRGTAYQITYNPKYDTRIRKEQLIKLKDENEDIYNKYVTTTESRTFEVEQIVV